MSDLFTPLEVAAWGGFVAAQSRMFRQIEADLQANFGLSHPEFEVLLRIFLHPDGRVRIQELAARSLLSTSGTSRAVNRLVQAGHLRREIAAEDGRGAYARFTTTGRAHFQAAAIAHVALVRRSFLDPLSADEQRQLAALWPRLGQPDPPGEAPKE